MPDDIKEAIRHFRYMQKWSRSEAKDAEERSPTTNSRGLFSMAAYVFGNCADYLEKHCVEHFVEPVCPNCEGAGCSSCQPDDSDRVAYETGGAHE